MRVLLLLLLLLLLLVAVVVVAAAVVVVVVVVVDSPFLSYLQGTSRQGAHNDTTWMLFHLWIPYSICLRTLTDVSFNILPIMFM